MSLPQRWTLRRAATRAPRPATAAPSRQEPAHPLFAVFPPKLPESCLARLANTVEPERAATAGAPIWWTRPTPVLSRCSGRVEGGTRWPRHRLFSALTCAQLFDPVLRHKQRFLATHRTDADVVFSCLLCEEPVAQVAAHCSYWDHMTRYVGVRLTANYLAHLGRTGGRQQGRRRQTSGATTCKGEETKGVERRTVATLSRRGMDAEAVVPPRGVRWRAEEVVEDAAATFPHGLLTALRPHPTLFLHEEVPVVRAQTDVRRDATRQGRHHGCGGGEAQRASAGGATVLTLVYEREDALRLAQLAALLQVLHATPRGRAAAEERLLSFFTSSSSLPAAPTAREAAAKPILCDSLRLSRQTYPMANLGERTFRSLVGKRVTQLLPPMGPEATSRVQQRCWGRRNWERLFDLLHVRKLQDSAGSPRLATEKNDKGTVMRQIVHELFVVQRLVRMSATGGAEMEEEASPEDDSIKTTASAVAHTQNVKLILIEEALQRLSFELVYLQSQDFMKHAWRTYALLGYPGEKEMEKSDYY